MNSFKQQTTKIFLFPSGVISINIAGDFGDLVRILTQLYAFECSVLRYIDILGFKMFHSLTNISYSI